MGNPHTTKSPVPEERDAKSSKDRISEATSNKTVSDLEESEEISDSKSSKPSSETSIPSPDEIPNSGRSGGRADESDTSGPM